MQIIPSILLPDKQTFLEQTKTIEEVVSMVQIDIADGQFVESTTWSYEEEAPETIQEHLQIDCELHLMVQDPIEVARDWEQVPQVKRILVHYESNPEEIGDILAQIQSYGWEVGLVLNPDTSIDVVDDVVEEIDSVMFMGVVPGRQGNKFVPEVLDNIKAFKEKFPHMRTEIDGSVNMDTLPDIVTAGVDIVCPGSAIFGNHKDPAQNVVEMRELINTLTREG